jgi:hypothetical protein
VGHPRLGVLEPGDREPEHQPEPLEEQLGGGLGRVGLGQAAGKTAAEAMRVAFHHR